MNYDLVRFIYIRKLGWWAWESNDQIIRKRDVREPAGTPIFLCKKQHTFWRGFLKKKNILNDFKKVFLRGFENRQDYVGQHVSRLPLTNR